LNVLIEPLILYLVIFLPGTIFGGAFSEVIVFSINRELIQCFIYKLPSLALVWYLLYKDSLDTTNFRNWRIPKPRIKDLTTLIICLPGLILIGFGVSVLSSWALEIFPDAINLPLSPLVEAPGSPPAWLVMGISCLGTGYLEESYFRLYLLQRLDEAGVRKGRGIFLSILLFSFCHIYEGPWGVLNAALAGLLLSLLFLRHGAFHGIAWAHSGYNVFVYIAAVWKLLAWH
jgi:membrane protease YdiL (CAAX protease family)